MPCHSSSRFCFIVCIDEVLHVLLYSASALQHHMDQLDLKLSPLDLLMQLFPKNHPQVDTYPLPSLVSPCDPTVRNFLWGLICDDVLCGMQIMRRHLGCFGVSGDLALQVNSVT